MEDSLGPHVPSVDDHSGPVSKECRMRKQQLRRPTRQTPAFLESGPHVSGSERHCPGWRGETVL